MRTSKTDTASWRMGLILTCVAIFLMAPAVALADTTVSVVDRGAKGDGTTNDSAAIQRAMDTSGPKTVVFPAGDYVFVNVRVPSGTAVVFEEGAGAVAPDSASRDDCFLWAKGSESNRLRDISLTGGTFTGQGDTDAARVHSALHAKYVDGLTVTGTKSDHVGSNVSTYGSTNVTVRDCTADYGKDGFDFTRTKHVEISGCTATNMTQDGILAYDHSQYIVVTGNTVDNYTTGGANGRAGIQMYGSSDGTVTGNVVRRGHANSEGIRFRDANGFWCEGNYVEDSARTAYAAVRVGDFPDFTGGDITFIRNTAVGAKLKGISADRIGMKPVRVIDNVIRNTRSVISRDTAAGISVHVPGSIVTGNLVDGSECNGISVGGSRLVVARNRVRNVGYGPTTGARVGIISGASQAVILENVVTDGGGTMVNGIRVISGSSALVRGNSVSGAISTATRIDGRRLQSVDYDYGSVLSASVPAVEDAVSVTVPVAPSVVPKTRKKRVSGYLKSQHTEGTYPVRIYRYRYVSGRWKSYGYVKARVSDYSTYSKYSALVRLPYKGRWRLKAYRPADSEHASNWSSKYEYVRVR